MAAFFAPVPVPAIIDPPSSAEKKQLNLWLLRMAIDMNVSLRAVTESEVLKEFMIRRLGWRMPHRRTLGHILPLYYSQLMDQLRQRLEGIESISITTDSTFLTRQQVPYIAITGHWVDERWQLHSEVLSVYLAEQKETGAWIAGSLRDVLETQLGLGGRVHCVVTDEGKNFLSAASILKEADIIRESLRCGCHRFQLTIKNAIMDKDCAALLAMLDKCQAITLVFKNGWASTKRNVLRKNQMLHLEQLKAQVTKLQSDIAEHNTRTSMDKFNIARDALNAAEESKDAQDQEQLAIDAEKAEVREDVNELFTGTVVDISDGESDHEEGSQPVSDEEKDEVDDSADVLTELTRDKERAVEDITLLINKIFKKRALVQKAATRWMTYVDVVERTLMWKDALMKSIAQIAADPEYRKRKGKRGQQGPEADKLLISADEAGVLSEFVRVGKAAKKVLEAAEGDQHTTIGSLLWLNHRLSRFLDGTKDDDSLSPTIKTFCQKANANTKIKFTAKVDTAAMIGTVLDPRHRSPSFLGPTEAAKCVEVTKEQFDTLRLKMVDASTIAKPPSKKTKTTHLSSLDVDPLFSDSPNKRVPVTELDRYLNMPNEDKDSDPLEFWRLNDRHFPVLSVLARRYLAIPASSASSERLFSRLKLIATSARQNLSSHTLCQLLFVEAHQHDA